MNNLPIEIINKIVDRLEIKDICALSCVNKYFRDIRNYLTINNQLFVISYDEIIDIPSNFKIDLTLRSITLIQPEYNKRIDTLILSDLLYKQKILIRNTKNKHLFKDIQKLEINLADNKENNFDTQSLSIDMKNFTEIKSLTLDLNYSFRLINLNSVKNLQFIRLFNCHVENGDFSVLSYIPIVSITKSNIISASCFAKCMKLFLKNNSSLVDISGLGNVRELYLDKNKSLYNFDSLGNNEILTIISSNIYSTRHLGNIKKLRIECCKYADYDNLSNVEELTIFDKDGDFNLSKFSENKNINFDSVEFEYYPNAYFRNIIRLDLSNTKY